ncbi:MAG: hypothetical protein Q8M62_03825 [Algoriphagus sp.]|uniref:DUF6520 family protein n=1 Tax=Algoriphagus sp. TaxID=1872435 RepID=UPI0027345DFA|nr:DUF6520 family protein [Algoriphagus sp.]MDP3198931.1 hypothetical protein [Algoriphagus sp.]
MNKLKGALPIIAFLFAAFAAVAFSPKNSAMNVYGEDGGQWYNVTGIAPGPTTYTCDVLEDVECLHDINRNPINPGEDKEFVKRGPLPPAN